MNTKRNAVCSWLVVLVGFMALSMWGYPLTVSAQPATQDVINALLATAPDKEKGAAEPQIRPIVSRLPPPLSRGEEGSYRKYVPQRGDTLEKIADEVAEETPFTKDLVFDLIRFKNSHLPSIHTIWAGVPIWVPNAPERADPAEPHAPVSEEALKIQSLLEDNSQLIREKNLAEALMRNALENAVGYRNQAKQLGDSLKEKDEAINSQKGEIKKLQTSAIKSSERMRAVLNNWKAATTILGALLTALAVVYVVSLVSYRNEVANRNSLSDTVRRLEGELDQANESLREANLGLADVNAEIHDQQFRIDELKRIVAEKNNRTGQLLTMLQSDTEIVNVPKNRREEWQTDTIELPIIKNTKTKQLCGLTVVAYTGSTPHVAKCDECHSIRMQQLQSTALVAQV
jgi:hypothetical protein